MNIIKRRRLFIQLLKNIRMDRVLGAYLVHFLLTAVIIMIAEPSITGYDDAVWYCFVSCSTIGFGDFAAVTVIGRIFTVLLYIYTIFIIAILTALFTQFMIELLKIHKNESVAAFMDKLENLDELSPEELRELSAQITNYRNKMS